MSDSLPEETPAARPAVVSSSTTSPLVWLVLALAFVSSFVILRRFTGSTPAGAQADYSWKVEDLNGQPVDLATYKGRPVFLNVWATWCGPCLQEMPSIAKLAANPKLKDVAFLCVSVDDNVSAPKGFPERKGWPMTVLHASGPAPKAFATDGIPATFVIGRDGRIARKQIGSLDWDDPKVIGLLESLASGA